MEIIGVLTGDVIKSSRIENKGYLISSLRSTFKEIQKHQLDHNDKFEIFRGDSFQIKLSRPEKAIITAILLKSKLRGITNEKHQSPSRVGAGNRKLPRYVPLHLIWDARISIGIGSADYKNSRLGASSGEAFTYSGHGLDEMKKSGETLKITTPWKEVNNELNVSTRLVDAMIQKWSVTSSETIFLNLLKDSTQKELAEVLKKTQPAIHKRLMNANEMEIKLYIERFEYLIRKKING